MARRTGLVHGARRDVRDLVLRLQLHPARDRATPALGRRSRAIYATDDRYTDDVHYGGGALHGLDLVDYELYMAAMNVLPPVPPCSVTGGGTSGCAGSRAPSRGSCAGSTSRSTARTGATGRCGRGTSASPARRCSSAAGRTGTGTTRSGRSRRFGARSGCSSAVEPHVDGDVAARAAPRPRARARAVVRALAPRRGQRRRRRPSDPGLRPPPDRRHRTSQECAASGDRSPAGRSSARESTCCGQSRPTAWTSFPSWATSARPAGSRARAGFLGASRPTSARTTPGR